MPPSRRNKSFGGSLLAVPEPLPDDDASETPKDVVGEEQASIESISAATETVVELPPRSAPAEEPETTAAADDEPAATPSSEAEVTAGERSDAARRRPPSTIRLDDKAGHPLFDAFLEAKQRDPFLSYRQFASGIVLDGLAAHRRRQKRS